MDAERYNFVCRLKMSTISKMANDETFRLCPTILTKALKYFISENIIIKKFIFNTHLLQSQDIKNSHSTSIQIYNHLCRSPAHKTICYSTFCRKIKRCYNAVSITLLALRQQLAISCDTYRSDFLDLYAGTDDLIVNVSIWRILH